MQKVSSLKFLLSFFVFFVFMFFANNANANIIYSQLDDSVEIPNSSIGASPDASFTEVAGHIKNLKFAYHDYGNGPGHFIGVAVVDLDAGISYYAHKIGTPNGCGSSYESTGLNAKTIVEFDETYEYKAYPCTGSNLVLDSTHKYGITMFRNSGGADTQRFYGSSTNTKDLYWYVENDSNFHDAQNSVTSFVLSNFNPSVVGVVDEPSRTINIAVPFGQDISSITPDVVVSDGATYSPSGAQNFNLPVTYTVTAVDGAIKKYKVKVTINCAVGCIESAAYNQVDDSVEINQSSISAFNTFTHFFNI